MTSGFALDGPLSLFILVLPWVLLALAVWLTRVRRKQPPPSRAEAPIEVGAVETALAAPAATLVSVPSPPPLPTQSREEVLIAAIEKAKAQRDDEALSGKSVELARLLLSRAQRPQAAMLLQSAALIARRANLPVVHAEARIELAELAHGDGDMTSACEHWQMAKLMFHDAGLRQERDRVAELMRQKHCPTDWVLTNF